MTNKQVEIRILPENKQGWFLGYCRERIKDFTKFPLLDHWKKKNVKIDPEKHPCKIKYHKGRKGKIYFYPCEVISLPVEPQMKIDNPTYHKSWGGVLIKNEKR